MSLFDVSIDTTNSIDQALQASRSDRHSPSFSRTGLVSGSGGPQEGSQAWLEHHCRRILSAPLGRLTEGNDRHCVSQLMHVLASRRSKQSAVTAEKILKRVADEGSYHALHDGVDMDGGRVKPLKPLSMMYNMAIDAWAKSGDRAAPQKAEDLLQLMHEQSVSGVPEVNPNTVSFNSVIYAWATVRNRKGAQRAEAILERMEQLYAKGQDSSVRPNRRSYSAVINAWAQCREQKGNNSSGSDSEGIAPAERAAQILKHMVSLKSAGRSDLNPDVFCFTNTMNAWARSSDPQKALRVEELLQTMEAMYQGGDVSCRPNNFTYTATISACAFTPPTSQFAKDGLRVASGLLKRIIDNDIFGVKPDSVMYVMLLKSFYQLAPRNDDQEFTVLRVSEVLRKCREDGQFSEDILREIKTAYHDDARCWQEVGIDMPRTIRPITMSDIPCEWYCNFDANRSPNKNRRKRRNDIDHSSTNRNKSSNNFVLSTPSSADRKNNRANNAHINCSVPLSPSQGNSSRRANISIVSKPFAKHEQSTFMVTPSPYIHRGNYASLASSRYGPRSTSEYANVASPRSNRGANGIKHESIISSTRVSVKNMSPSTTISSVVRVLETIVGRSGCVVRAQMELDPNVDVNSICSLVEFERPSDVEKVLHVWTQEDIVIDGNYAIVRQKK